jgi:hypothetical protein
MVFGGWRMKMKMKLTITLEEKCLQKEILT